jgi:hypothetical protein
MSCITRPVLPEGNQRDEDWFRCRVRKGMDIRIGLCHRVVTARLLGRIVEIYGRLGLRAVVSR